MEQVIILGSGCAGLSAAVYAARAGLSPLVLEGAMPGGLITTTSEVENFPGFPDGIDGVSLVMNMRAQAEKFGARFESDVVERVELSAETKKLFASSGKIFECRALIVATGASPKLTGVKGEKELLGGNGVSTCATCDGAFFRGRGVAVIGGGLTGCEIAYELALHGKKPLIVEMKDDLVAQKGVCLANSSFLREWFALNGVPVYLETALREVKDGAIVCAGKDGKEFELACDSVISCAGYIPAPLTEKRSGVQLIGDCRAVGNLRSVVWEAYEAAMKI